MNSRYHFLAIKMLSISTTIIAVVLVASLFINSSDPIFNTNPNDLRTEMVSGNYSIQALPMPLDLSFADEPVPLNKSYVRESYDREILINTYWQSQTLLLIKRASRFFPVIEPILKAQGIPDDFKYLAAIESGLMPRIVSPAGAAGIWQFMPGTAKEFGLEVNKEIDERYHLEKSTVAACRYFKKAYEKFGSWALAAASYNAGFAGMEKHLATQKTTNYYDLLLSEETGRYVFRILATRQIIGNPQAYGFLLTEEDLYQPVSCNSLEINGPIPDFADFAKEHGVTYRELKDCNPWLRETFLTNVSGKSYILQIPVAGAFNME